MKGPARARLRHERARLRIYTTPAERDRGLVRAAFRQACALCPTYLEPGDLIGQHTYGYAHEACLPESMKAASAKARRNARRTLARSDARFWKAQAQRVPTSSVRAAPTAPGPAAAAACPGCHLLPSLVGVCGCS